MGKTSIVIDRPARTVFARLTDLDSFLSPLIAGEAQKEEDTELTRLKEILDRE